VNLNHYATFADAQSNQLPNLSEIDQCAAELSRFKDWKFSCRPPSWISAEVDFRNSAALEDSQCIHLL